MSDARFVGADLCILFARAMRLLETCDQRSGRIPLGLTDMLTHLDEVSNHCMQRIRICFGGIFRDSLPPIYFRHSTMESIAISRSFLFPPNPDAPVARPAGDIHARCATSIYPMQSCSTHRWRAAEVHHGSQCDEPMWVA